MKVLFTLPALVGALFAATLVAPIAASSMPMPALRLAPALARPAIGARLPQLFDNRSLRFTTLDDNADPTFNQLLGINNDGLICGYFGSGADGHPNKGYTLAPPYSQANYTNENFPGSVQTQVTGLNNARDTTGFWVDAQGNNFGFVEWNGVFTSYKNPHTGMGTVNQLLGINNHGIAVGFYVDGGGMNHGYELNQATGKFRAIAPPGGNNAIVAGINNNGDVTGFLTAPSGGTIGFLRKGKTFTEFSFPSSMVTTPLGINDRDQIVGSYVDGTGNTHGFILSTPLTNAQWKSVDDPNGVGGTIINGLNDKGDYVGFYVDAAGNTDGFLSRR